MALYDHKKFAVFILSNRRAEKIRTINTLKKHGYTGKVYIIIDNEDPTGDEYRELHGSENVIEFDKKEIAKTCDLGDSTGDLGTVVHARNASFAIAKSLGLDYFLQVDDDYGDFGYRWPENGVLNYASILSLDKIIEAMLTFLDDSGAVTVAMSQGGDTIGGVDNNNVKKGILRKAMNSFFFRTDRPLNFMGRINEDVNAYVVYGSRGQLFFTIVPVQLVQQTTQKTGGGMTKTYLDEGTYTKSFFSVMMAPSCVKISMMGDNHRRYHHMVSWNNAVPKIINEKHKKRN